MSQRKRIRVLIAEDHLIVRDGLKQLLESEPDIQVVGEADDGLMAVEKAGELEPDLVLMDISLPMLNGVDATRRICEMAARAKVVGLSVHGETALVMAMLKAGASGYVRKDRGWRELLRAVHTVCEGGVFVTEQLAGNVVEQFVGGNGGTENSDTAFSVLSDREREVLHLVAEGLSSRDIAAALHVGVKTVASHRSHIMQKLNLHSVAQLTRFAMREGLIQA